RKAPFEGIAAFKDLALAVALAAAAYGAASFYDVVGQLALLSERHPEWPIGEVIGCLAALAPGLAVIAWRRTRDQQTEARLRRHSESRFAAFEEASSEWIWEMSDAFQFTWVSAGAPVCVKTLVEQARQGDATGVEGGPIDDAWARHRAELARKKPFQAMRLRLRGAQGAEHHLEISGRPLLGRAGEFLGYRGAGREVSEAVAAEARAEQLFRQDALTGLPNRAELEARLDQEVKAASEDGARAVLLCIDLDRFRLVNAALGSAVGDQLLIAYANRMRAAVGDDAIVARISGDEFAIVKSGVGDPESADSLARSLVEKLAEPFDLEGEKVVATASIGLVLIPDDGDQAAGLLGQAELALFRAKREGGRSVGRVEPGMAETLKERTALERDLRYALADGQFELHYQPQILAGTQTAVGVEALLRWRHPERGLLLPADFLPVAEESGLIVPLGEWILRTACTQTAAWPDVRLSVNLSPAQFRRRDLIPEVRQVLEETGLDPKRLELEITEAALLANPPAAFETLDRLRELGIAVAMDDFGTAYSSPRYLQRVGKIKIDRSFVAALERREDARTAVRAIVGLGRSFGVAVCAEGVETERQFELLSEEGCAELQGFYLSRPLEAEEITRLLPGDDEASSEVDDASSSEEEEQEPDTAVEVA
ncbi:MAG: putative bifunctional diguanylate cyclase/phosphodiesterase, partial [Geminicoccales bacterium]